MIINMAGESYDVEYVENGQFITNAILNDKPQWITYDTETIGLHIKKDKPFLGAVAWDGKVFVFPTSQRILEHLRYWSQHVERIYAHNTTYDMHMTANIMGDRFPVGIKNWGDTMCLARLTFEAISSREGGDSLALKQISKKYIDPSADRYKKAVKGWLKAKEAQDNKVLTAMLREIGVLKKDLQAMLDGTLEWNEKSWHIYQIWQKSYPKPGYQDVPMEIMMPYVAVDVILTNILVRKSLPVVEYRNQQKVMEREFRLIPVVYKMERKGIPVDRKYLEDCAYKMDQYINDLNIQMHELAGREFSVGQHAVIKEIYTDRLGYTPESTDKQFLNKQKSQEDELAVIISKLRRLEKWKSTYIDKILKDSAYDGRFYSQLNQYNPVSGRFSGDSQQFPKDAVYTLKGDECIEQREPIPESEILFNPRKAFLGRTYYLDYSQVELRVQGHYTIPFGGDINLCRAYMPFKCVHYETGEIFDYETVGGRKRWIELREGHPTDKHWEDQLKEGWSVWVVPETKETWKPTDVHTMTTLKALVAMGKNPDEMTAKEIAWWRKKGKQFNFMRNYGGGDAKAAETLEIALEQAKAMNKGYTDAFPMVVTYQKYVEKAMYKKGYVENLRGRRYYLSDSWRFYKCANYLIQGSCADFLKEKMIEIDEYITSQGIDWMDFYISMCIHDELQFLTDEKFDCHIPKIKEIMEDTPGILVPIIAEVEFTDTDWASKKKVIGL